MRHMVENPEREAGLATTSLLFMLPVVTVILTGLLTISLWGLQHYLKIFADIELEQEVQMVAAAEGYRVDPLSDFLSSHPKNTRFSTLQDLDAGRHTEIDMFLGTLIKKAEKHGLKVPFSEYTFHAIHALEEKNDGLFDFG